MCRGEVPSFEEPGHFFGQITTNQRCISGLSRYLPATNSRLQEVQRVACQRAFVKFAFAEKGVIAVAACHRN